MKLYENVVIGNFLFGLGLRLGRNRPDLVGVNLLQQSPWDAPLADVLLTSASICRIIEFKRSASRDKKEKEKQELLVRSIDASDLKLRVVAVSREIHWYVEIDDVRNATVGFDSRVLPYYDLGSRSGYIDLPEFLEGTAKRASSEPLHDETLSAYKRYLHFLMRVNQQIAQGKPAKAEIIPGTLVLTVTNSGQVRWLTTDDFGEMFLTRRGYELKLDMEFQRERNRNEREIEGYDISA